MRLAAIPIARVAACMILLAASAPVLAAKGRLGFATEAETDGLFKPVLTRLTVVRVADGSAGAQAGLRPGDRIVAIDGTAVAGAEARPMGARLRSTRAGQRIALDVDRGGQRHALVIIAAPAP